MRSAGQVAPGQIWQALIQADDVPDAVAEARERRRPVRNRLNLVTVHRQPPREGSPERPVVVDDEDPEGEVVGVTAGSPPPPRLGCFPHPPPGGPLTPRPPLPRAGEGEPPDLFGAFRDPGQRSRLPLS